MSLVRIDLRKGKDEAYRKEIGRMIYHALVDSGAPRGERFQIIAEHDDDNFLFDPDYLGVQRSENLVIIQITLNEGWSLERKQSLYKAIADGLHYGAAIRREDVLVSLVEVRKENWSFGNGVAQLLD